MQYTQPGIIKEQLELVWRMIYEKKLTIPVWRTRKARYTVPVQYEDYGPWEEIRVGDTWLCDYDDSRWFEADVTVPEDFAGRHLVLELMLGGGASLTEAAQVATPVLRRHREKAGHHRHRHKGRIAGGPQPLLPGTLI